MRSRGWSDVAWSAGESCAHEDGTVSLQSIPNDQHLPADGGRQRFQEFNDLRAPDRTGEQAEIEIVLPLFFRDTLMPSAPLPADWRPQSIH
jgi:hypothetical protein